MSDNIVHLPISNVMARRLRMAKARERYPTMFESPPPAPAKKKPIRIKGHRPPTPSYGPDIIVIDSDGRRHPPMIHRQAVAALVLEEVLRQHDNVKILRTPSGIMLWRVRQDRPMSDRMIKAAVVETKTIVFCKHGHRQMGPPDWLPNAVRFAVFDRSRKKKERAK